MTGPISSLVTDADGDQLTIAIQSTSGSNSGTWSINDDSTYTYTPAEGFVGSDEFTLTASDDFASTSAQIVVDVTNTVPVVAGETYDIPRGESFTASASTGLLANDSDADSDALQAILGDPPSHGSLLDFNVDGSFIYEPNDPTSLAGDEFTYRVTDGAFTSDPITVHLQPVQNAPEAQSTSISFTHNQTFIGKLSGHDQDGDSLTYALASPLPLERGSVTILPNGDFAYSAEPDAVYETSFEFTVFDLSLIHI